jgi:hypothetical protein
LDKYLWSQLTKPQVGKYGEYFVKMELTLAGFDVYTSEVDDKGIDFIARRNKEAFVEIQVKTIRKFGYIFMKKSIFALAENKFLVVALLIDHCSPELFVVPSLCWQSPDALLADRDYKGKSKDGKDLKSDPEWGLNLSGNNMKMFAKYCFQSSPLAPLAETAKKKNGLKTVVVDNNAINADWTKQTWDLPPYNSREFFQIIPAEQLDEFRQTPVYLHAVKNLLIHDDEWVADYCAPDVTPSTSR